MKRLGSEDEAAKAEIKRHVVALFDAYIAGDVATLVNGRSNDWKGFLIRSTNLIRGVDAYRHEMAQLVSGLRVDSYEFLDFEIELHGDLALVFYVARDHLVSGDNSGEAQTLRTVLIRSIDVYGLRDGSWIQTGSNICAIPEPTDPTSGR